MNTKDYRKLAQLCAAIQEQSDKKQQIIEKILQLEGDINFKIPPQSCAHRYHEDSISFTALNSALDAREIEIFNTLLAHGADFTAKNEKGETILHQAIANSCLKYANCWKIKGRLSHPFIDSLLLAHINSNNHDNPRNQHGLSYFHAACMTNNSKAVEFYVKHGVSVNEAVNVDSKTILAGYTGLHLAARYCCLQTAKTLIKLDAKSNLKNSKDLTAFQMLIERNMEIVDWMNMGKRDCYDQLIADFEDNEKMIKMILDRDYSDWKIHDHVGLSRLHIVCTIYDESRIENFLLENPSIDLERAIDVNSTVWPGYTALHFAARFNVGTVKLLMKKGTNILAKDANGITPFDLCLKRYEAEDLHGIVTSQPSWKYILLSDNKTRLSDVILAMRSVKDLQSFLDKLINVNIHIPEDSALWPGCTILHVATMLPERNRNMLDLLANTEYNFQDEVEKNYYNCSLSREKLYLQRIQVCSQTDLDVTAQDIHNSTPLHRAFRLRRESAANAFLRVIQQQKDIRNCMDDEGLSHLHIACAAQRRDLIDRLLNEANVNEPLPSSRSFEWFIKQYYWDVSSYLFNISADSTLLHIAVTCENADLAELLLRRGADLYARDVNGLTPVHRLFVGRSRNNTAQRLFACDDLQERLVEDTGFSHLHVVSLMADCRSVTQLLDNGAQVNCKIDDRSTKQERQDDDSMPLSGNPAFDIYDYTLSFLEPYTDYTPLHFALENQDAEVAKLLVKRGADVLAKKKDGSAPLYTILESRQFGLLDFFVRLLENDADLRERVKKDTGVTMLHVACATLEVDAVKKQLDNSTIDVNVRVHEDSTIWPGCTPLHLLSTPATQEEKDKISEVLRMLLERGADVTLMNAKHSSPIHRLYSFVESYVDNHSHVDALLEAQKDLSINPINSKGLSHFHIACARNRVHIVKEFLAQGYIDLDHSVDHFHASFGGYTPLHVAVYNDCRETIDLLLKHGANVHAEDRHGNTPLHVTAERDDISLRLIERIVKGGANIRAENLLGKTLLEIMATKWSDIPPTVIELLLQYNWPVNTYNPLSEEGTLAMVFSTSNGNRKGVDKPAFKTLMRAPKLTDLDEMMGRNVIHNIVSTRQPQHNNSDEDYADAIEMMVRSGCDYDHRDHLGRTPLHLAVKFRQIAAITGLLQSGADVNIVDATGRPAYSYILKYVHRKLVHDRDIIVNLAVHLLKMVRLELDVSEINVETVIAARKVLPFNVAVGKEFDENLERLKERKISSTNISLYDFLSETGAVSSYPYTSPHERILIKEFFDIEFQSLRKEFPEVAGFLRLQYKKARERTPLIDPAIASLTSLLGFELPVLCADVVLKFLRNEDLKRLIAAVLFKTVALSTVRVY